MKLSKKYIKTIKRNNLIILVVITTAMLTLAMLKLAGFCIPINIFNTQSNEKYIEIDSKVNQINTETQISTTDTR